MGDPWLVYHLSPPLSSRQCHCWLLEVFKYLWECCPCGLHCAISRLSWLTDYRMAPLCFVVSLLFSVPYQSLRWYNVIISSSAFQMPVNWSADHRPCWFFVGFLFWCFCVLCLVLGFCCLFFVLHGDSSMDYVSIQFSSLLYAHGRHDWCCHCINSVNLQNTIVFPAW